MPPPPPASPPPPPASPPPPPPDSPPPPPPPGSAPSAGTDSPPTSGCVKVAVVALIVLGVLGLAVTGAVVYFANRAVDEIESSFGVADPADYDVEVSECGVDSFGDVRAAGRITNTSDRDRSFTVRIRFTDADGSPLLEDSGYVETLEPGQSSDWVIVTFTEPRGRPSCDVDEVRYSSVPG